MRVLVIGASGLVGSHVLAEARARGHQVAGTSRSQDVPGLERLDLADEVAAARVLERFRPEAVVYAAGWTWVDGCERDPARSRRENVDQPLAVARWCRDHGARMLYFSTSYVFDGLGGPYAEDGRPNPLNVYGADKLRAEEELTRVLGDRLLVARLICVWGREALGKNFAYQVARAAAEAKPLRLPADQLGNPTWAGDVATWSIRLLEAGASGIWHLAGDAPEASRIGWAAAILDGLRQAGLPHAVELQGVPTCALAPAAPRPLRAGMLTHKAQVFHPIACRPPGDAALTLYPRGP